MKYSSLILLLAITFMASEIIAQNKTSLEKWTNATINLQAEDAIRTRFATGTAIYVIHNGERYLYTAAHVIIDWEKTDEKAKTFQERNVPFSNKDVEPFARLRVTTSFDSKPVALDRTAMSYVIDVDMPFACKLEADLAIVSLNTRFGVLIANRLDSLGYIPVETSSISSQKNFEIGSDVMCIGFPAASEVMNSQNPFEGFLKYQPIYSFGRIASKPSELNYFWADISVFPGNSGGPVLQNNKVIGIVSEVPLVNVKSAQFKNIQDSVYSVVPFGKMRKAWYFESIMEEMIKVEKAKKWDRKIFEFQAK